MNRRREGGRSDPRRPPVGDRHPAIGSIGLSPVGRGLSEPIGGKIVEASQSRNPTKSSLNYITDE